MSPQWTTPEELAEARRRFEAAIPGWQEPQAYGVGVLADDGHAEFARVNVRRSPLPAVVLATVCGHRHGSGSYKLDAATLHDAIDLLAPAQACTTMEHPNLVAWRNLYASLGSDDVVVAVFAADLTDDAGDSHVAELLRAVHNGKG